MLELVLIFELEQIEDVLAYIKQSATMPRLIACDFWVERELAKRGVVSESFSKWSLSDEERADWLKVAGDIAREWYRIPEMDFFTHRGIRLAEASEPAIDGYLQFLFYYFLPLKKILHEAGETVSVVVPNKHVSVPQSSGSFTKYEITAITDLIYFLAKEKNITVIELGQAPMGAVLPFPPQPFLINALKTYNFFMRAVGPRKPLRIFASENWYHIAPFIEKMDDVELVLMDRSEIRNIPLGQLWKHRIRFIHPIDIQTPALRKVAEEKQQAYASTWKTAQRAVSNMPQFMHEHASFWPLVAPAFNFFVEEYARRLVYDADALATIYKNEKIGKVLLRASVSGHQPHFYIAAKVAMAMNIPSIELQHAGAVLDPHNVSSRMEASYLAGYGTLTRDIYAKNHGYPPGRMRPIGSPRFDAYRNRALLTQEARDALVCELGLDPARPIVLAATPSDQTALVPHVFDSYENARLFKDMAALQKALPQIQVVFKFRGPKSCAPQHREYIDELFGGKNYAVVGDDLFMRIRMSDIAFSGNSTAMYEVMMAKPPLVLFPWRKTDIYSLPIYSLAAPVVFTHAERVAIVTKILNNPAYAKELVENGTAFLEQHYAFDGHASERMIALLHEDLIPF